MTVWFIRYNVDDRLLVDIKYYLDVETQNKERTGRCRNIQMSAQSQEIWQDIQYSASQWSGSTDQIQQNSAVL